MHNSTDKRWRTVGSLLLLLTLLLPGISSAQTLSETLKSESVEILAAAARQQGKAVNGAVLFTHPRLGCTRCHAAGVRRSAGPDLSRLGRDVSDVYLIEALLQPSKVIKKGFESTTIVTTAGKVLNGRIVEEHPDRLVLQLSAGEFQRVTLPRSEIENLSPGQLSAMPDNLVDQLSNRKEFLDLARYLMELAATDQSVDGSARSTGGATIAPELQGIVLLKQYNCAACHRDDVTQTDLREKRAPDLRRSITAMNPHHLQRFIADPLHVKPGTTMPDVMAGLPDDERRTAGVEIAHYLASLGAKTSASPPPEADAALRGRELFHSIGCVACHSPLDADGTELLAQTSVPLGEIEHKYHRAGLVAFLEHPLETRRSGQMPDMKLTHWEAVDIASYLLLRSGSPTADVEFAVNAELAEQGQMRFHQLGCGRCHSLGEPAGESQALALSQVQSNRGCLSGEPGNWPLFSLSAAERQAIQSALRRPRQPLSLQAQLDVTLTNFRCLNCHQRNELGGVTAERDSHFQTADPNLGPQGRLPPTLTGVGAKLNPQWMRQVLVSGRSIRPYVLTRMPQFGAENVTPLVDMLQQSDALPPVQHATFEDDKEIRQIGAELVGTGGLNCIVCHTFQLKQSANMSAVDLTEMTERLQKDWFYHYLRDPQSLSPNTIMPSFWPRGRAMRRDVLNGDSDLQIEALWLYLSDGRQARTPRGLIQEPLELLATDEAVMLRRSYPGIGKRGIGVGYPQQVNLAFDAEQLRLAMIWKGKFADPGGVWRSQGHGMVRPLGDHLIRFAPGADLDDLENPWIPDDGRPPQHRFQGYALDEAMRPRFRYQLGDVKVEDYVIDVLDPATNSPFLRRRVTVESPSAAGRLAFRAATGVQIEQLDDRNFVVDGKLTIRIDDDHAGTVSGGPEVKQLRIPLDLADGAETLSLEYRW